MPGQEYLEGIRTELQSGRRQRKMGQNVLSAFGYIRRRATAIQEINAALDDLGLVAHPPINSEMPLTTPRIRFELKSTSHTDDLETVEDGGELDSKPDDGLEDADEDWNLPEPAFKVSELKSASRAVEWVPPDAPIRKAYTKMVLNKYSQLVVASSGIPFQKDVKGIVSFRSVTRALMNGEANIVGQCIEDEVPFVHVDTDLKSVVSQLSDHEVVLVIGPSNRLQGIVTAWDLAEEFAELVDPFKRIGEIEERLRTLLRVRLGEQKVLEFLVDEESAAGTQVGAIQDLTMGDLKRALEFPEHWCALEMPFEREEFVKALDKVRDFRNRLMHFRDPLNPSETTLLTNFCDAVREVQL